MEKCFEFEKKKGFERITKSVGNMLRITAKDSLIVNYIKDRTPEKADCVPCGNWKMLSDSAFPYGAEQFASGH